jgi:hypothetical protein
MSTQYTRDYFIAKFEAIPEELWTTRVFRDGGKCCAMGHCGANYTDAGPAIHTAESVGLAYKFGMR